MDMDIDDSSSVTTSTTGASAFVSRLPISSSRDEPPRESPSDVARRQQLVRQVLRLLELFDDVIVEEYSNDHASMPCLTAPSSSISSPDCGPLLAKDQETICTTCDFCGADIFQSYFECRHCVLPSAAMDNVSNQKPFGEGLAICPSCYVDGRSCPCEYMTPVQCRPFGDLLRDRNKTINVLELTKLDNTLRNIYVPLPER